jgi:hypothetical protein
MRIVKDFPANYSVHLNQELPGSGGGVTVFNQSGLDRPRPEFDGPLVSIEPAVGVAWLAGFSGGYNSSKVVDAFFTTPNPDAVCAVVRGAGYWVNTQTRLNTDVPIFPILQVLAAGERMLFVDFSRICAFNSRGLEWNSESLTPDELTVKAVDAGRQLATCVGWDAPPCKEIEFSVDLRSGRRIEVGNGLLA